MAVKLFKLFIVLFINENFTQFTPFFSSASLFQLVGRSTVYFPTMPSPSGPLKKSQLIFDNTLCHPFFLQLFLSLFAVNLCVIHGKDPKKWKCKTIRVTSFDILVPETSLCLQDLRTNVIDVSLPSLPTRCCLVLRCLQFFLFKRLSDMK